MDHRLELQRLSLDLATKPDKSGMPSLPEDPTALNDESIIDAFFELTEWGCYARAQALDAAVRERWAERAHAVATAEATQRSQGKTLADRRNAASLTAAVLEAEREQMMEWARRKALDEAAETAERRAAALSRELSRRGAKVPRSSKWAA